MSAEDAVMLTDRLLSVLREAARPMSTAELAELMPWKHERTAHGGCQWWCDRELHGGVRLLECHGGWHLIAFKRTAHGFNGIYRLLRALEQRGLVRRDGGDASPRVYWSYYTDDGRPRSSRRLIRAGNVNCRGHAGDARRNDSDCHPEHCGFNVATTQGISRRHVRPRTDKHCSTERFATKRRARC